MSENDPTIRKSDEEIWSESIGPVYSVEGGARMLGLTQHELKQKMESGEVFYIDDGEAELIPLAQFGVDTLPGPATFVDGMAEFLSHYKEEFLDRWTFSVWLNLHTHSALGMSPADYVKQNGFDAKARTIITSFMHRMKQ